jgi:peptidoglycan-N-acetylglucosamine deacetylase
LCRLALCGTLNIDDMRYITTIILGLMAMQISLDTFCQAPLKNKGVPAAIICLTYDDALPSQLDNVIPQLNALNLKATFFVNSLAGSSNQIGHASPSLVRWKAASIQGHELGNHTLFHPCPERLGWEKEVALETYDLERLMSEIRTMHTYLDIITGKKSKRAYAYPCNETSIGGVDYAAVLRELGIISYGRSGGDAYNNISNGKDLDGLKVPSWHVMEGTTGAALIEFVERTIRSNGLGIFQFHDIGGLLFNVSEEAHQDLLNYLSANADRVRVMTFSDAVAEMKQR